MYSDIICAARIKKETIVPEYINNILVLNKETVYDDFGTFPYKPALFPMKTDFSSFKTVLEEIPVGGTLVITHNNHDYLVNYTGEVYSVYYSFNSNSKTDKAANILAATQYQWRSVHNFIRHSDISVDYTVDSYSTSSSTGIEYLDIYYASDNISGENYFVADSSTYTDFSSAVAGYIKENPHKRNWVDYGMINIKDDGTSFQVSINTRKESSTFFWGDCKFSTADEIASTSLVSTSRYSYYSAAGDLIVPTEIDNSSEVTADNKMLELQPTDGADMAIQGITVEFGQEEENIPEPYRLKIDTSLGNVDKKVKIVHDIYDYEYTAKENKTSVSFEKGRGIVSIFIPVSKLAQDGELYYGLIGGVKYVLLGDFTADEYFYINYYNIIKYVESLFGGKPHKVKFYTSSRRISGFSKYPTKGLNYLKGHK